MKRRGAQLREKRGGGIIVTTPDGRLVGVVERATAERVLAEGRDMEDERD